MIIIKSINKMHEFSRKISLRGKTLGFVPTMGALHQGHLSLIRRARKENDYVVVSIFVNPSQFSPQEDLKKYPRNLKKDSILCRKEGVDVIFFPDKKQIYPEEYRTYVEVEELSSRLCGRSRPGHFKGVATIVTKLFHIISPDKAYFGQKDAQQAIIIKKLVRDLNLPVKIRVLPTVRETNGLALSSRNLNLSGKERKIAAVLPAALKKAKQMIKEGVRDYQAIIRSMEEIVKANGATKIDYISIVDLDNLQPVKKAKDKLLIALAVWVGRTRLIDNIILSKHKFLSVL